MEAVLNSNFALYGLRIGLDESALSLLLPVIGIGGLALQLPLGMLSDRIGRKRYFWRRGLSAAFASCWFHWPGERVAYRVMSFRCRRSGRFLLFFGSGLCV
nr:hypothetical protein [Paenibacillus larvae]